MRSPLAPRMTTVSDSMPSYWFVWYIHTPTLLIESHGLSQWYSRVQACAQYSIQGDSRCLYCHKPAQESKLDLYPSRGGNIGALHAMSAERHAWRRACSRNVAGAPISARSARYSAVQRPARSRMTNGGGSVRVPSQAHVKSPIRGGKLAWKYTSWRRTSVRPAWRIACSGVVSSAAWQKQKVPWAVSDRAAAWQ